jgi:hypothetical protein
MLHGITLTNETYRTATGVDSTVAPIGRYSSVERSGRLGSGEMNTSEQASGSAVPAR